MSPKLRKSRLSLVLGGLLAAVLIIVGINVKLALRPEAVQARARAVLENLLQVPFEISAAEFHLSDGVSLSGLRVFKPTRGDRVPTALLDFPRIRIVPDYGSLFFGSFEPALVVLDGGEIDATINEEGVLDLVELLRAPPPSGSGEGGAPGAAGSQVRLPDFRVRGMKVRFADKRRSLALAAEEVDFSLGFREGEFLFNSSFSLKESSRVEISGRLPGEAAAIAAGPLEVDFMVYKFDLAGDLASLLDDLAAGKLLKERSFSGSVDLTGSLRYDRSSGLGVTRVSSSLAGCGLQLPVIEKTLRLTGGAAVFLGDRIEIRDARGELAGGSLSAAGSVGLDPARGVVTTLKGSLRGEGLSVDEKLLAALAPELNKSIPGGVIRGRVNFVCEAAEEVKYPPAIEELSASMELSEFQIAHGDLPYPVEELAGRLKLEKGLLELGEKLTGKLGAARLTVSKLSGLVDGSGAFEAVVDLGGDDPAECLALDGKLRGILGEQGEDGVMIWDSLAPEGWVAAKARIVAEPAPAAGEKRPAPYAVFSVYPRELKIRHRLFPYTVEKISGEAVYDSRHPESGVLLNIEGRHGGQKIACKGSFDVHTRPAEENEDPPGFEINITSSQLQYDKDIRAALQPEVLKMVDTFAFKGAFKTSVSIASQYSGEPLLKVTLDLLKGEIQAVDFPYRLQLATGRIVIDNNETILLSGFKTAGGPGAQVSFDGSLRRVNDTRKLDYRLLIADFKLDEKFRAAFPAQYQNFLNGLGLEGTFSGRLAGWYLKNLTDSANDKHYFEGTEIRTRDAAVNFGVEVSQMDAQGRFTGGHNEDRPNHFWGEVKVQKARFNRLQLKDGDIVFTFGEQHDRIRRLAESVDTPGEKGPYLSSSIIGRLARGDVTDTFQMSIASENFYKGRLDGMLYVDTGGKEGDLGGEFAASGISLSEASVDVFGGRKDATSGTASGTVFFAGKTGDQRSIRGEGVGLIKEANLAQLPLFLDIFKLFKVPDLINLGFSDLLLRSKLDNVKIPYTIEDGRFLTEGLELNSSNSGLSFSGVGSMDFDGNLALELEPQLPSSRLKLPLIPELIDLTGIDLNKIFSFIKKGILKIKIGGDIARPKAELATGLGLIKVPIDPGLPEKKGDGGAKPPPGNPPGEE